MNSEKCGVCYKESEYKTVCDHSYCMGCLSRLVKCGVCKTPLIRAKLCEEIKGRNVMEVFLPDIPKSIPMDIPKSLPKSFWCSKGGYALPFMYVRYDEKLVLIDVRTGETSAVDIP